jgi:hypothetical protein
VRVGVDCRDQKIGLVSVIFVGSWWWMDQSREDSWSLYYQIDRRVLEVAIVSDLSRVYVRNLPESAASSQRTTGGGIYRMNQ